MKKQSWAKVTGEIRADLKRQHEVWLNTFGPSWIYYLQNPASLRFTAVWLSAKRLGISDESLRVELKRRTHPKGDLSEIRSDC